MKIALAGFGQEGKASYEYWNRDGNTITVADEREILDGLPENVETILGAEAFTKLSDFDLIIRSPSVNPKKLPYGDKVWSATNEFLEQCPAPIIGVTGTKGKGTTSSLITSILEAGGKAVHLVGNIGTPGLTELHKITPDDIVVFELSSFQLWDAKKSPHVAVVLMIEADHLDVHNGMQDYIDAKANIAIHQSPEDIIVFNTVNAVSRSIAEQSSAEKIGYPDQSDMADYGPSVVLPGRHNVENAAAAVAAAREYVTDSEIIKRGLHAFTGLPHRLKFVAEKNGVKYYDDSIATTPGSAIAALASFEEPKILILGGKSKGADYTELVESCVETDTTVIAVGANGPEIARLCREAGVPVIEESGDMMAIVIQAAETAGQGSVVLLSPAAASFDMFKSYVERGNQFIAAVSAL
jgi:UDP-N-acetylmuramoylalanine--D-glutamate ligase